MYRNVFYGLIISSMFLCGIVFANDQPANVAGEWEITIKFIAGTAHHTADIKQEGEKLSGIYKGEFLEGAIIGTIKGTSIDFTGFLKHEATPLRFHYTGKIESDIMKGSIEMGEYWTATFTATRKK